MHALTEWGSFYLIAGPAAGALIGLQFVVLTLIAEHPPKGAAEAGSAFANPTIVHFSAVLLLAALLRVPWHTIIPLTMLWGLMGLAGLIYVVVVARRMRRQTAYQPVFEDQLFHIWLPALAYLALASSAPAAFINLGDALFGVGAISLILLFTGIHNAWDAIAYHVFTIRQKQGD